ncbi:MAG TPA: ATP-binding protein [Methylomirabilota bacterium]|nr:ATP-binding protein [Methylomirabilota bacterium]
MSDEPVDVLEERLLLLAPTGNDSADATKVLKRAGFCVTECGNLAGLCGEIERGAGALLMAEEALSRGELPNLVARIKSQSAWSDLPIILLTGRGQLSTDTNRLFGEFEGSGNITLLERPFRMNTLLSTVRMALRGRRRQYQVRELLEEIQDANVQLERRVAERTVQLNSSVKSLEAFCHSLSHDLRAPLRAIQGFMTVFESDYAAHLDEEGRKILHRVRAAAVRMDALINDLLALSRVSQGAVPLGVVNVGRIFEDAMNGLQDEVIKTGAEITTERLEEKVRANAVILRQVFENFLSNALKYTKRGHPPQVRVWSERKDGRVRVSVKDEGIGIAPQYHYRVFELFQRLHHSEYPGTGVGLAIAKVGAERMCGNVGVISELGEGSCFWIELEAAGIAAASVESGPVKPSVSAES